MNQTFEQRIQSIEDQLKEIRKELEESLERYKHGQYPFTDYDWPISYPKALETKCLWDSIPVEDRMKPMETVPSGRLETGLSVVRRA